MIDYRDHLDHLDLLVSVERMDLLDTRDILESLDFLVYRELLDPWESLVHPENKDNRELGWVPCRRNWFHLHMITCSHLCFKSAFREDHWLMGHHIENSQAKWQNIYICVYTHHEFHIELKMVGHGSSIMYTLRSPFFSLNHCQMFLHIILYQLHLLYPYCNTYFNVLFISLFMIMFHWFKFFNKYF